MYNILVALVTKKIIINIIMNWYIYMITYYYIIHNI